MEANISVGRKNADIAIVFHLLITLLKKESNGVQETVEVLSDQQRHVVNRVPLSLSALGQLISSCAALASMPASLVLNQHMFSKNQRCKVCRESIEKIHPLTFCKTESIVVATVVLDATGNIGGVG